MYFKPLTWEDIDTIKVGIQNSNTQNCGLSLAYLYGYNSFFKYEWSFFNDFIQIRGHINGEDKIVYLEPLGSGNIDKLVEALSLQSKEDGQPLRFYDISDGFCQSLQQSFFGNQFHYINDNRYDEYIYLSDDLRHLSGNRYQTKRNHINRFKRDFPSYSVIPLSSEHLDAVMERTSKWHINKDISNLDYRISNDVITTFIKNMDTIQAKGIAIIVDNVMAGFSMGVAISDNTYDIVAENGDTSFEGIYSVLCFEMAKVVEERYIYLNRENDMGLDGLKSSKHSYHPVNILKKWNVIKKESIEYAEMRMFRDIFGDDEPYICQLLFNYIDSGSRVSTFIEGRLAASAYILPFQTHSMKIAYIFAVMVAPFMQGKGIGTSLFKQAINKAYEDGYDMVMVIPQEESLKEWYSQRFGMVGCGKVYLHTTDNILLTTNDENSGMAMCRILRLENYLKAYFASNPRSNIAISVSDDIIKHNDNLSFSTDSDSNKPIHYRAMSISEVASYMPLRDYDMEYIGAISR